MCDGQVSLQKLVKFILKRLWTFWLSVLRKCAQVQRRRSALFLLRSHKLRNAATCPAFLLKFVLEH